MSSRALRKLQRERDTELFSQAKQDDGDGSSDVEKPDTADSLQDRSSVNHKTSSGPANLFDLVRTVCVCVFVKSRCLC